MFNRPAISIVLPAWNAERTIGRAVESIRQQTWEDWELLVIDDGSTDGTREIVTALAQRDARIHLLARPHAGIVSALNTGMAGAEGQWIARMDADDQAHPERLAEQAAVLRREPEIGLVSCLVEFAGDAGQARGYALHVDWMNSVITPREISLQRFIESPFAHPSVMFRRALVERLGAYREGDFPEDYELWLRWLDAEVQMAKVPRVLLAWHDRPDRLSRRDSCYESEAFYRCKAVYLARWLDRHVDPGRAVLVWGAGRLTRRRSDWLAGQGIRISGYIDIDPHKIGRQVSGRPVLGPSEIPKPESCFVLGYVGKRGARELASSYLRARGFEEGRDFLLAA